LIEQIQKNNLQNVVRFLGQVPHAEIKKFFYVSDLFALLTHPDEGRVEGLGLVFLEAAATGLPSIAGKSGGVEEAVQDGVTGVIVDIYKGDKLLVETISDLLNDSERLKSLGKEAKLRIQYNFKWEAQLAKLNEWL
jgi:phosphatidylinositol alpha-1,6-mannosyltransferase